MKPTLPTPRKTEKSRILVTLALILIGLVAFIGPAIDLGNISVKYAHLRQAVDGAALAVTSQFRDVYSVDNLQREARRFMGSNGVDSGTGSLDVQVDNCKSQPGDPELCTTPARKLVRVTVTQRVPLFFMFIVGLHEIPIKVSAISEVASVDIVLLIDTSPSMALDTSGGEADPSLCNVGMGNCHPMQEVKAAASSLVDTLSTGYDRVSIVTFNRFPKVEMPMSANLGAVKNKIAQLDVYEGSGKCPWDPGIYPTTPAEVAAIDPTLLKDGPCRLDVLGVFSRFTCQGLADPNPINWDARDCTTTNSGGGLRVAGNVLAGLYPDGYYFPGGGSAPPGRPTAQRVVVWLTDGYANTGFAHDGLNVSDNDLNNQILINGGGEIDPKQDVFCPRYTWQLPQPPSTDSFRPCADLDARPTLAEILENPTTPYILGRHAPDPAGTPFNNLVYDADDYARDMVDFVTDPLIGQNAMVFGIGLGNGVLSKTPYEIANGYPAPGETLLKYGAYKGNGTYYFAPDADQLDAIVLDIANKIATLNTYTISGNAGVAGATITYTGGSTIADGSGLYSITVPGGWTGSVVPVKAGYSFTPASRGYSNLTTDQPGQDFTGAFRFIVSNGMPATLVLGQTGFTTKVAATTQTGMNVPASVAVDPATGKVFVADELNNRVLRFGSLSALSNGAAAEAVLGQPNFTSSTAANTPSGMDYPSGVFVDIGGRLWVADFFNNRVLRFDAAVSKTNGAPADGVLGQPNFTRKIGATTQNGMANPVGVSVDAGGRLWVAEFWNSRVLRFDNAASLPNGAPADGVLGQPDFVSLTKSLTQSGLNTPYAVFVDLNDVLWVADYYNNRVLRFDNAALKANGAPADGVLGQPNFTSGAAVTSQSGMSHPSGLTGDGAGRLYVMDGYNNRVLVFNDAASKPNGGNADNVLGQTGFTSKTTGTSATTLSGPYHAFYDSAAEVLWVADRGNNRVLLYGTPGNSYTVSGILGVNGAGANLAYTGGATTADAVTGAYSFRVPSGWTGLITPAKGDYSFAPLSIIVSAPVTADLPGQDFAATLNPYTISGNAGVGSARIAYTGTVGGVTTAEAVSGDYSFRVPAGWSGAITASRAGYTVTPASIDVSTPVTADLPGQDFTASLNARLISGNAGLAGAVLTYTDGQPKFVTADASGDYSLTVSPGWSGRVIPLKTGYGFEPPSRSYTNLSTDQPGQDFTAEVVSANPVLTPGGTTRVSLASGDIQTNNGSGTHAISANGRYLVFESRATNLVAGDTNGVGDVFLRDLQLGTTTRISVASDGTQANGLSSYPAISADGRFVVFESAANNLVAGDSGTSHDIFLRDTQIGATTRVSVPSGGLSGDAFAPSISADGRYVVFQSSAYNLVPA